MQDLYEKENDTYMNIENFSIMIGKTWNVESDLVKNYLFSVISSGLVRNNEIMKDLEKLYMYDRIKYYNAAVSSTCINHIVMKQNTLDREINARKVLGLFLIAETDSNLRDKLIRLLRKHYADIYNSAKKHNKKDSSNKYKEIDSFSKEVDSKFYSTIYFYFSIYRTAELVNQVSLASILDEINFFEFRNAINADISNELEIHKSEIQEIKALLRKKYGKINSFKDILLSENEYIERIGGILENLFIINKLDIDTLFYNYDFINTDEIILAYIKTGYKNIEPELILSTIINGIFIKSLITEYKKTRTLFFENNTETFISKITSLEEELNSLKSENEQNKIKLDLLSEEKTLFDNTLTNNLNKFKKIHFAETNEINTKLQILENQLFEEKKYRRELNALREYIFKVNNGYIPKSSKITLRQYIINKKIVIIGGAKEWRRKFREKYPEIRSLNGFNENFEINILSNSDCVFFYTGFMNHATYNRAMNYIRTHQINFGYIGKTNIELVEEEIIEELTSAFQKY